MKKNFMTWGSGALLMLLASLTLSSCSEDASKPMDEDADEYVLQGELTGTKELKSGEVYVLKGGYHVKKGGMLKINEGVTVLSEDDGDVDYILVEQGGMIDAQGTATKPIVMTSDNKEAGAWGGIHICGKAPINLEGGSGKSEIGDASFGGDVANDNSGVLRYIRLEYTGYAFSEEKESNGFTFYGVGNGTQVEYLQAYKGADDGFEWFGGTVNGRYLVSSGSGDDSFDWTDGWVGKGQFWVAQQLNDEGDCLIEADNRSTNVLLQPISSPTLSNLTLVGNNSTASKRGARFRAGTYVKMYNTLITGKPEAVTTETAETENSFGNGLSAIEHTLVSTIFKSGVEGLASANGNAENATIALTNGYVGVVAGGKDMSTVDNYFVKTTYKGAVSADNDWTKGWTKSL
ncbi:MAG: hypothetical protein ACRC9Q_00275 [Bacteroidales bacterium]